VRCIYCIKPSEQYPNIDRSLVPRKSAPLITLGLVECGLAVWVLSGQRMRQAATAQTALLAAMNSGGLIWAWHLILIRSA
jgi:hypothetical protein